MAERQGAEMLDGVAATTLWTLRNRAVEAMRPDGTLDDPWAIELYQAIDWDWDQFGKPSQSHPLRALAFDHAIHGYLAAQPRATVVALGEGLQTTYWRLGSPDIDWITVDLPAVIDLRERLLPNEPRVTCLRQSALDRSWMDRVTDPDDGVFIAAEGLFMYLEPDEVHTLIGECARRFPGGRLMFDCIPRWFSNRTMKGLRLSDRYTAPPMPHSLTVTQALKLADLDGVASAHDVPIARGRGPWGLGLLHRAANLPWLRDRRPSITLLRFAP